eukprot:6027690-Karenia_brevis.AAC.1
MARRAQVDNRLDGVEAGMSDIRADVWNLQETVAGLKRKQDFQSKGQRIVVVDSGALEALYLDTVQEGNGGWKRMKEEAAGALSKEMALAFGLTMGHEDPADWAKGPGAEGEDEGKRDLAAALMSFHGALSTRGVIINVDPATRRSDDGKVRAALEEVLETELRRYARVEVKGGVALPPRPAGDAQVKCPLAWVEKTASEKEA